MSSRLPAGIVGAIFSAMLLAIALLALTQGPMSIDSRACLAGLWQAASGQDITALQAHEQTIVLQLRLPRLVLAILVGALLALAGAAMQGLFRNALADPGITGVATGAALGAICCLALAPIAIAKWLTPIAAFWGGLLSTLLVYRLARSQQGTAIAVLLLAGIAISAFGGAVIGFLSYMADDRVLRDISLWQMGSLAGGNLYLIACCVGALLLTAYVLQRKASCLNALALGEAQARHLGLDVERDKLLLIIVAATAVGVSVAAAGIIGFVGLVVPHLVRMLTGPNHHSLLPLSALLGALLLTCADFLARYLASPAELPVGLVTALVGGPFFFMLLLRQRRHLGAIA